MSTDVTSVTKSLDRIADALEGGSGGGSSAEPLIIETTGAMNPTKFTMTTKAIDVFNAFKGGRTCLVSLVPSNTPESENPTGYEDYGVILNISIANYPDNPNWVLAYIYDVASNSMKMWKPDENGYLYLSME